MTDIKCLSIRQPWLHAIVHEGKSIENRTRRSHYRGPLLLAASARLDDDIEACKEYLIERGAKLPLEFPLGGIVAIADMIDCVEDSPSCWFEGPYGYVLKNVRQLPFTPIKGRLGLFSPTPEILRKLKEYL